jgi:N-acetylglutamate synthase-like GNAT family acetyltransferase
MGVGQQLVQSLEEKLKHLQIRGLHIMTGPDAMNKNFYKKLGFHHEVIEEFQGSRILLMGKAL